MGGSHAKSVQKSHNAAAAQLERLTARRKQLKEGEEELSATLQEIERQNRRLLNELQRRYRKVVPALENVDCNAVATQAENTPVLPGIRSDMLPLASTVTPSTPAGATPRHLPAI